MPPLYVTSGLSSDLSVTTGGSTSFSLQNGNNAPSSSPTADFIATPTITGLPQCVTATFTPAQFLTGGTLQVTLNAAADAPVQQNVPITVTATIDDTSVSASKTLLLSVTRGPGTMPNNRMSLTALEATPVSVAFDRLHHLIFASNLVWNRIDVLSSDTRAIVRSIPLASPAKIDLSQGSNTLWIGTQSQQVFALSTTTMRSRVTCCRPSPPTPTPRRRAGSTASCMRSPMATCSSSSRRHPAVVSMGRLPGHLPRAH